MATEKMKLQSGSEAKTAMSGIWDTIKTVVYAVLIALLIRTVAYEPFNIPSGSMIPTLLVGDYLFVSKFSYGYSHYALPLSPQIFSGRVFDVAPARGDVVVFKLPRDNDTDYIKRVIGLPGDVVQIRDGEVYVDGVRNEEPYVLSEYRGRQSFGPAKVPENEYFVLGDHRNSSNDSRMWGTVARDYIYGKAQLIYWPVDRWGLLE